jgi:hypothetical protein
MPSSMKYSRVFWQICSIFSKEPAASSFILKDGGSPIIYKTFYESIKLHGVISQKNAILLFTAVMSWNHNTACVKRPNNIILIKTIIINVNGN